MSALANEHTELAFDECARLIRSSGSSFYHPLRLLPKDQRRAIYATYAFCRICDDIVDDPAPDSDMSDELDNVLQALEGLSGSTYATNPVFVAVHGTIDRYGLDVGHFKNVVEGCRMDISKTRYETFDQLAEYCLHVAGAVGLIFIDVLGYRAERAREMANELGIAFQLTNILRDVVEDARRDRVYIPQEDLREFGVKESDIPNRTNLDAFTELMRFEAARAREFYSNGIGVISMVESGRVCLRLLIASYSRLLNGIDADPAAVLTRRVRLKTSDKLSIIAGVAIDTWLRRR